VHGAGVKRAGCGNDPYVKHDRREAPEETSLRLEVPPTPETVSEVRQAFDALALNEPTLETARLLVTELITNSIRHAGLGADERIRIRAEINDGQLRVDVLDGSGRRKPQRLAGAIRPPPGAESGWGLFLVDRLATRWGWGGDGYWFELERVTEA